MKRESKKEVVFSYVGDEGIEIFIVNLGEYMDDTTGTNIFEKAKRFDSLKDCLIYMDINDNDEDCYDPYAFNYYYIQNNKIIKQIKNVEVRKCLNKM